MKPFNGGEMELYPVILFYFFETKLLVKRKYKLKQKPAQRQINSYRYKSIIPGKTRKDYIEKHKKGERSISCLAKRSAIPFADRGTCLKQN